MLSQNSCVWQLIELQAGQGGQTMQVPGQLSIWNELQNRLEFFRGNMMDSEIKMRIAMIIIAMMVFAAFFISAYWGRLVYIFLQRLLEKIKNKK
jgi:hypothetical protein